VTTTPASPATPAGGATPAARSGGATPAARSGGAGGVRPTRPDTDLTVPPGDDAVITTDDGAVLAATVAGDPTSDRAPVVLPHCWTGSRAIGVPVARRLIAAGHRVVFYDQRGHGASTLGSDTMSIERLGADLAAVLDQLNVRDAVLAGHSMGGMTVMGFACHHPDVLRERVRGLALVATAAHGLSDRGRKRLLRLALRGDFATRVMSGLRLGNMLVRPTFGVDPAPEHVDATRALFAATPAEVRRACVEAMGAMDLRRGLAAVDVPTVVLLGRRDTLIANSLTRAIVDHIAGADLVELPGAGHMLPLERPDDVVAAVRRLAG
jgi:non-heme chloroperoxidase